MRHKQLKTTGWRVDRAGVWHYVMYELVVFGYGHPKERRRVLCGMRGGATHVPAGSMALSDAMCPECRVKRTQNIVEGV